MPTKPNTPQQRAQSQERKLASRLGGAVTPGSGNQRVKGDVRVASKMRIECKTTEAKSFSVTRRMLDKIGAAGQKAGEFPALVVEFTTEGRVVDTVAVVPKWVLDPLCR